MTLMQAPPGVEITLTGTTILPITGTDQLAVSVLWLGRIVH